MIIMFLKRRIKPLKLKISLISPKLLLYQLVHLINSQLLKDTCIGIMLFMKKLYLSRWKNKSKQSKDYLKNKFDQLGASLINFFLRSDRTQDKTSILLEAINLDEKINMYFSFPWPFHRPK